MSNPFFMTDPEGRYRYIKRLALKGVHCFQEPVELDFGNGEGHVNQWTVILGNNGMGKTTLLRAIAALQPQVTFIKENGVIRIRKLAPEWVSGAEHKVIARLTGDKERSNYVRLSYYPRLPSLHDKDASLLGDLRYGFADSHDHFDQAKAFNREEASLCPLVIGYGITRRIDPKPGPLTKPTTDPTASLFHGEDDDALIDIDGWLRQLDHGKTKEGEVGGKFTKQWKWVQKMYRAVMPGVKSVEVVFGDDGYLTVEIENEDGRVPLSAIGYGYQASMAWLSDFARRMFEYYPEPKFAKDVEDWTPLQEPAVLLIDEIDLHLHPEWQRKIIGFLSQLCPRTQFIVTAHSPMIVQAAEEVNVVALTRDTPGSSVTVRQYPSRNFQGWGVEDIMRQLMGMGERVHSIEYVQWMRRFDEAIETENYAEAKAAWEKLNTMLPPESHLRNALPAELEVINPNSKIA